MVLRGESRFERCYQLEPQDDQIAGFVPRAHPRAVDPALLLDALERALTRLGILLLEEELPDEAHIDGGLCKVGGQLVIYVSPTAPPWRRAQVLLDALRRLPHGDVWLPPEIRRLLQSEDFCDNPVPLIVLEDEEET
jgi:hypothetical protein